jgi:hypothetical protein
MRSILRLYSAVLVSILMVAASAGIAQAQPTFSSTPVTTATVGTQYTYAVSATDPSNNVLSFSAITKPAWLTLNNNGQSSASQFGGTISAPSGIAGDPAGNLYVTNQSGTGIYKIAPDGTTTLWFTRQAGTVYGLYVYNGDLYISYYMNIVAGRSNITKVNISNPTTETVIYANTVSTNSTFLSMTYYNGFFYVAAYTLGKVIKISATTLAATDVVTISTPFGLGFNSAGILYIVSRSPGTVSQYNLSTGILTTVITGLSLPSDVKIDINDNIYVSGSQYVRKYAADLSSFSTVYTTTGSVWGMSLTPTGALVFGDNSGSKVARLQTGASLTGTPALGDIGNHNVTLRVSNGTTTTDQSFTIAVSGPPTISTISNVTKNYGDAAFTITDPTSNSAGAFSYSSGNTGVATVSGNTVTIVGAGSAVITATQAPNGFYTTGTKTFNLTVNKIAPVFGSFADQSKLLSTGSYTITPPTSTGPGNITYTSSNTSVATVSGTTVTLVGAGTSTITANQAATTNYNAGSTIYVLTVTTIPVITTGAVSGSITACAGTASASSNVQQFNVSGVNLTADINATAPTGFEVSTTLGSGYGSSVTLTQTNGTVNSTTIYVRSSSTATTGTVSGNVSVSSGAATPGTAAVSGRISALPTSTIYASGATTFCAGGNVTLSAATYALQLNGSNGVTVANGFAATDDITYEATITPTAFTSGGFNVIVNHDNYNTGAIHFQFANGTLQFSVAGNAPNDQYASYTFNPNTNYKIAAVYSKSGKYVKFYVNGALVNQANYSTAVSIIGANPYNIGSWNNSSRRFQGMIDNIRIWNLQRSTSQLLDASNNVPVTATTPGLVRYYRFDEGTGTSTSDDAGNGTGTLVNNPSWSSTTPAGATYVWSPGAATTQSITANTTGNYTVQVTAGSGCTVTSDPTVVTVNPLPTATIAKTDANCLGGSITVTATSGTAPYQYSINGGASYQSSNVFSGLGVGNYSVYIKDANTCANAVSIVSIASVTPEINITGNSVSIVKGDITPVTGDNTDFGSMTAGTGVSKTYTIQNTGNAALTVSSIDVSGISAAEFTVSGIAFPLVIAANSNADVTINFASNATGNRTATITINSDDCDEASYDFAVKATATCTAPSFGNVNVYIQNSTGANGCTAIVSYPLSVNGVPAPAVTYTFTGATTGTGTGTGSGQTFNKGITHVVVTATSGCGTPSTAFDVTVVDDVKPKVITKNNTIYLDATGRATLNASSIDNGSTDNCSAVSFMTNSNGIICATAAEGSYLTLTAPAGKVITGINFASYGNPTGSCGSFVTGSCHASNSLSIVSSLAIGRNSVTIGALNSVFNDPCNGTVKRLYVEATYASTGTSNVFTCSKLGNNEVTLIVTDADGNTESGTATVTVADSTRPVVRTRNLTLCLDANGNATITPAMIENGSTDNCSIVSYSLSQTNFNNSHVGVNTVTLSVRDASGNIGTATATVTINALPVVYTVTGGGAYCTGAEGVAVDLSNSQAGIIYRLYNSNGNVATVSGTGSAINFGIQTVDGAYTVNATNPATGCSVNMSGAASVTINATPVITVTPASSVICAGNSVVLTAAQTQTQTKTYKVALSDLLNTPNNCGGDSWYGNDQPGFRWYDEGNGTVTNVQIQFSMGVECNSGMIHTGYLNNWAQSAYFSQVSQFCSCGIPPTPAIITLNMNGDGYVVGGENTFNIYNENYNWMGFITDASLDNSFALVTVTYGGSSGSANINNWVWTPGGANTESITVNPATTTSYTATGTDENGCSATATATVTVNPLPAVQTVTGGGITCGTGVAIGLTGSQTGIRYQLRRNGSNIGSPVNGNGGAINFAVQSVIGTYTVVATNTSTSCITVMSGSAIITSGTAPVFANTNASIQAFATATTCNATVSYPLSVSGTPAPTVNYTFTGTTVGNGAGTGSGSVFNKGVTHVTVIAINGCGTRNYNFDVTVTDNTVPTITAPATITVNTDAGKCGATVDLGTPVTADNCGVASVTNNGASFATNGLYPVGTTTVTWTVTDNSGLTATATQVIKVTDNEKPVPVIAELPAINGQCSATVTVPTATDNCAGTVTATTSDPLVYNEQGTYTITWTYTDTHNNTETQTQTVIVKDITPPTISCPGNINVIATSAAGAVVNYTTPVTADNCSVVSSIRTTGLETGSTFPIGTTTVTYTVTDIAGLTASCSFDVTVAGLAPQIICPQNIVVNNDATKCGAIVNFAAAETTAIPASVITYSIAPGSFFPVGTTTVTATATNAVGVSVCTFTITVVDTEKPTITAPGEYGVVNSPGQCGAILTSIGTPEISDNCGVASVTNDHPSTFYPVGETIVTWTVTDIHGNVTDTAKQLIRVIDNERPTVITQNITIQLDANGTASITPEQINNQSTDNCGIASITLNKTTFNCSNTGANTVILTVTDIHGHTATKTAIVTVQDMISPVLVGVPSNSTVECNAIPVVATVTATDNCTASTDITITQTEISTYSADPSNVLHYNYVISRTWRATDVSGNYSESVQTITVRDITAPVITCPASVTLNCQDNNTSAATGVAIATDICTGSANIAITQSDASTYSADPSNVLHYNYVIRRTWRATDVAGNYSECVQTITVQDVTKPVLTYVPANISVVCSAPITPAATGMATGTDNCAVPSISYTDVVSSNGLLVTRTWKAMDVAGNFVTGVQVITIIPLSASIASLPTSNIYTGGNSTNLYIGYGAQSTVLQVNASSQPAAGAPYTYSWSGTNLNQLSSISSSAPVFTVGNASGYYTYTVTITNRYGCSKTASISLCVTDIRVAGSNGKVYVCHMPPGNPGNRQTLSISVNAVDAHLTGHTGDRLGSCDQTPCNTTVTNSIAGSTSKTTKETEATVTTAEEELKVIVMPNPSTTFFTLKLESKYETPVTLRVMDAQGRVVDARSKIGANSTLQIGHNYSSGTYYAELIQGTKRKVVQLVKGRG